MLISCVAVGCLLAPSSVTAFTYGGSPWEACNLATGAAEAVAKHMEQTPAEAATVDLEVPVTLSSGALGGAAPTFEIASSPTLISTPDIDHGTGSAQAPGTYSFTSTRATSVARTIYWVASYTFVPEDCEHPVTFTTPVRTLSVVPPATPTSELESAGAGRGRAGCIVPRLIGDSLGQARRALRHAHCALGAVSKRGRDVRQLVVTRQSIAPGRKRSAGTEVAVGVGARAQRGKQNH